MSTKAEDKKKALASGEAIESIVDHEVIEKDIYYSKPSPTWVEKVKTYLQLDLFGEARNIAPDVMRGLFRIVLTDKAREAFYELESTKSKTLQTKQGEWLEKKLDGMLLNKATLLYLMEKDLMPDEPFSEVVMKARGELEVELRKTLGM